MYGPDARAVWAAPAPALPLPGPTIRVLADTTAGSERRVAVEIASPRQAPMLVATVEGIAVTSANVQGRVAGSGAVGLGKWRVDASGLGAAPLRIDLVVAPGQPFTLRVRDRSDGLAGVAPRPATMVIQPFGASDTTTLVRTMAFQ